MQKGNALLYWAKVVSLGMVLGLGIQFAEGWVAPTLAPPAGNIAGPITTTTNPTGYQTRGAGLGLTGVLSVSNPTSLQDNKITSPKFCLNNDGSATNCITSWPATGGGFVGGDIRYTLFDYMFLSQLAIAKATTEGDRFTADKITNYVIVNDSSLQVGKKYGYILGTSGEQSGHRVLADGTLTTARCYNGGTVARVETLTFEDVRLGIVDSRNAAYNRQGTFVYNPRAITAGNGTTGFGHLIAKNTYKESPLICDYPGKGSAVAYVYDVDELEAIYDELLRRTGNPVFNFHEGY